MKRIWVLSLNEAGDTIVATEHEEVQGVLVKSGKEINVSIKVTVDGVVEKPDIRELLLATREEMLKRDTGFKRLEMKFDHVERFIEAWSLPVKAA
jgi:hypothetical protein